MEREDKENKEGANADSQSKKDSAPKVTEEKGADDVVKDENIPVTYIDTTPDIPVKE